MLQFQGLPQLCLLARVVRAGDQHGRAGEQDLEHISAEALWRAELPQREDTAQHTGTLVPCSHFHQPALTQRRELVAQPSCLRVGFSANLFVTEGPSAVRRTQHKLGSCLQSPQSSINPNHLGTRCQRGNFGVTGSATSEMRLGDMTRGERQLLVRSWSPFHQSKGELIPLELW